jgi:hypothetical protein
MDNTDTWKNAPATQPIRFTETVTGTGIQFGCLIRTYPLDDASDGRNAAQSGGRDPTQRHRQRKNYCQLGESREMKFEQRVLQPVHEGIVLIR